MSGASRGGAGVARANFALEHSSLPVKMSEKYKISLRYCPKLSPAGYRNNVGIIAQEWAHGLKVATQPLGNSLSLALDEMRTRFAQRLFAHVTRCGYFALRTE